MTTAAAAAEYMNEILYFIYKGGGGMCIGELRIVIKYSKYKLCINI